MLTFRLKDLSGSPPMVRHLFMVGVLLIASFLNILSGPWLLGRPSLLPFMVAVVFVGMVAGVRQGTITMLAGVAVSFLLLVSVGNPPTSEDYADYLIRIAQFAFLGIIILWLINRSRTHQNRSTTVRRELERREEQLRAAIESLPVGVWFTDQNGMVITLNEEARRIWEGVRYVGVSDYQYPMRNPETGELLKPEEYPVHRAIRGNTSILNELVEIDAFNGDRRKMTISCVPLHMHDGRIFGTIVVCENVTERLRNMEELQRAKEQAEIANHAKDRFLAILSHELRTPLTPVLMLAEQLEDHPDIPESLRRDASLIRRHINLEARLIDDLLDLTRIEKGRLELNRQHLDIHHVLTNAVNMVRSDAEKKEITLVEEFESERHYIFADRPRIKQVILNILNNALKFTPAGGRIRIRTETADNAIRVRILDTGIGIDPDFIGGIFGEFEQADGARRRYGGLGLGLPIARALLDLHDGTIEAHSKGPGRGTEVIFNLPAGTAADQPIPVSPVATHPLDPGTPRFHILLVEDHEPTAFVLARLLRRRGHQVTVAGSVTEAIAYDKPQLDFLISDIGLPDGTGVEIARHFRSVRTDFHAIALSGFGMEADVARSLAAGFDRHLIKPVDFQTLHNVIDELAGNPPGKRKTA